jgi:6,7-dimethyl-8-ribityllumazine synthase
MNNNKIKIAVIVSRFNEEITKKLKLGAMERLAECGIPSHQLLVIDVPGAIEIPLIAKKIAMQKSYDAIICLGAVIRGETSHYDYVCEQASSGCQQVMLQYDIPVIFGVLTTENEEQAFDRAGGSHGHKGCDAVDAALEMIKLMRGFSKS